MTRAGSIRNLFILSMAVLWLTSCRSQTISITPTLIIEQATLTFDQSRSTQSNAAIDLDTGQIIENAQADLKLNVSGGSMVFNVFQPINGAQAKSMGADMIGLDECRETTDALTDGNIPEVTPDNHLCLLTTQDRVAWVRIIQVENTNLGEVSVKIEFSVGDIP